MTQDNNTSEIEQMLRQARSETLRERTPFLSDGSGTESNWPIAVNGHLVGKRTPKNGVPMSSRLEFDQATEFFCNRCGHSMNAPKNRIEDSKWAKNAFGEIGECLDS